MTRQRARWALCAAVTGAIVIVIVFAFVLLGREALQSTRAPKVASLAEGRERARPSDVNGVNRASVAPAAAPERVLAAEQPARASDDVAIMRAHGDDSSSAPRHPHPITPEHERIFRENALLAALNGAVDLGAPEVLREFNQRYRDEFPEGEQELQAGYELIAECLEQLDDATRARARRYFDEERASTLRRYVKRYCLD